MKILKDSRQMPKKKEFMANKMYNDKVYAWLQVNSHWDSETNIRWLNKKEVSYVNMASDLNISRQTASTRFKRLLDTNDGIGLVHFNEEQKRYELCLLQADAAMLIEKFTLRKMMSTFNENTINTYIYLLSRYIANQEKQFEIIIRQVKEAIGLSTKSDGNNYIVTDILEVLKRLGLVDYKLTTRSDGDGVKNIYMITNMSNKFVETSC